MVGHMTHGILMIIAFGLLMPAGALVPRCWRGALSPETRHVIHRTLMQLATVLTLVGVIVSIASMPGGSVHFGGTHKLVGLLIAITACGWQPLQWLQLPRRAERQQYQQ